MGSFSTLDSFLEKHSSIKAFYPSDKEFSSISQKYLATPDVPSLIVRPQSAEDVAALVSHCAATSTPFVVRAGGHDMSARSTVNDILQIDLRDISHVNVSSDRKSALVGGGVLGGHLQEALDKDGLMTPTGTIGTVGYVGWATFGGYSSYTPSLGLGIDQILGAKIVLASGELVDADEELLRGIRGAGPALGVITELEIKVYPKQEIQAGMVLYESKDLYATIKTFWPNWNKLVQEKDLPDELCVMPALLEIPGMGKVYAAAYVWNGPGSENSNKWFEEISSLALVGMQMVAPTSPSAYLTQLTSLVPTICYPGSSQTVSTKGLAFTDEIIEAYAKHAAKIPGGGPLLGMHQLRGKASRSGNPPGVFRYRGDHLMLEIVGLSATTDVTKEGKEWAEGMKNALKDLDGVMEGGYYSLLPKGEVGLDVIYGEHWETVKKLKEKVDPGNVFKFPFSS
ncbi:d-lactate dehydrogenase [Colletotrichum truncatum]|uniref:D-lactate dehydrogenase n=1 Tax=Colletotrichum truncatum TaxID=5467 RepID=A0ACC3ZD18_COLTU|nr:d-lactate dehydrogenase [Colletotrichum truncatum]KAF6797978.1 d-lactate dehydrogenase [Colletotrichum truncatum]